MKKQTISSGSLDTKVSIQLAPTISRSASSNEVVETPGQTITVWAMRESDIQQNTQEDIIGETFSQKKLVYYIIRYRPNIGAKCILSDSQSTYNIIATDPIGRKQLLKLRCELISQDNV